ncbi:MAG TPA: drug:proton antiporter, partial [Armatimonadetes bacterium]|nr:drug:proton antiporter [Armatimonadota bacterium]
MCRVAEVTEPAELSVVHELRRAVFVLEQGVSEAEEWDGLDGECRHWLAWAEDRAVGTARLRVTGDVACVQRVAVAADWRRRGVGRALM